MNRKIYADYADGVTAQKNQNATQDAKNKEYKKVYVKVIAEFLPDGTMTPLCLYWGDRRINIDYITDVRPAPSLKAGGQGLRYCCRIYGNLHYIWYEDGRWFVEARKGAL